MKMKRARVARPWWLVWIVVAGPGAGLTGMALGAPAGGTAAAAGAGDVWHPILRQRGESEIEVDLGMVVRELLPPLLEAAAIEDPEQARRLETILDLAGIRALDRVHLVQRVDDHGSETVITVSLDPQARGGMLGEMLARPPGEFRFARYLRPEDSAFVAAFPSFARDLPELLDALAAMGRPRPGTGTAPHDTVDANRAMPVLQVLGKEILPLLSGELDVLILPDTAAAGGGMPPVTLVLGTSDGPALRDKLLSLAGERIGEEAAAALRAMPGETTGPFTFQPLPMGVSFAVSPEFLLITRTPEFVKAMVARTGDGLVVPPCLHYVREHGMALMGMTSWRTWNDGGDAGERLQAGILRRVAERHPGPLEVISAPRDGTWRIEVNQRGSSLDLVADLLREGARLAPRLAELSRRQRSVEAAVELVDGAMTRYGEEHDGTYPERLEALVEEGYLEALPPLPETPLGVYAEGAYSYVTLRNRRGGVTGYYYFVYGDDPRGGFDVFTADNVREPQRFVIAGDGEPDGVMSFCYDGSAIPQVKAWREAEGREEEEE